MNQQNAVSISQSNKQPITPMSDKDVNTIVDTMKGLRQLELECVHVRLPHSQMLPINKGETFSDVAERWNSKPQPRLSITKDDVRVVPKILPNPKVEKQILEIDEARSQDVELRQLSFGMLQDVDNQRFTKDQSLLEKGFGPQNIKIDDKSLKMPGGNHFVTVGMLPSEPKNLYLANKSAPKDAKFIDPTAHLWRDKVAQLWHSVQFGIMKEKLRSPDYQVRVDADPPLHQPNQIVFDGRGSHVKPRNYVPEVYNDWGMRIKTGLTYYLGTHKIRSSTQYEPPVYIYRPKVDATESPNVRVVTSSATTLKILTYTRASKFTQRWDDLHEGIYPVALNGVRVKNPTHVDEYELKPGDDFVFKISTQFADKAGCLVLRVYTNQGFFIMFMTTRGNNETVWKKYSNCYGLEGLTSHYDILKAIDSSVFKKEIIPANLHYRRGPDHVIMPGLYAKDEIELLKSHFHVIDLSSCLPSSRKSVALCNNT